MKSVTFLLHFECIRSKSLLRRDNGKCNITHILFDLLSTLKTAKVLNYSVFLFD